jgi:hypothetical protein
VGDEVSLPAEKNEIKAKIEAISTMDDATRAWLAEIPTAHVVANA